MCGMLRTFLCLLGNKIGWRVYYDESRNTTVRVFNELLRSKRKRNEQQPQPQPQPQNRC